MKKGKYLAGLKVHKTEHAELLKAVPAAQFAAHPLTKERGRYGHYGLPCVITFQHEDQTVTHRGQILLSGPMRHSVRQGRAQQLCALRAELTAVRAKIGKKRCRSVKEVPARTETCLRHSPVGDLVRAEAYTTAEDRVDLRWWVDTDALWHTMQTDGRYLLATNSGSWRKSQFLLQFQPATFERDMDMDAATWRHLNEFLSSRTDAIADRWRQAVLPTSFSAFDSSQLRQRFVELTEQAIGFLLAEPHESARAESLGTALADLHFVQPESLGRTLQVLSSQIVEGLSADCVAVLQPGLAALLSSVAVGFFRQAQKIILVEQEQIRQAVVAERLQSEAALRKSEETAQALLNAFPDAAILIDTQGLILASNEIIAQRVNMAAREIVGQCVYGLFPPEIALARQARSEEVIRNGAAIRFEDRRAGRLLDNYIYPVCDAQGKVIRLAVLARDVTEQRQMETALKENEERYRKVVETSPDSVMLIDLNARILVCSRQTAVMHGYKSAEELLGKKAFDLVAPEDRGRTLDHVRRTLKTEGVRNAEYTLLKKDGARFFAEVSASVVMGVGGRPRFFVVIARDITERKWAEEMLERRAAQLALLNEAGQRISAVMELESVLDTSVRLVHETFGYHHVALFIVNHEQGEAVMKAKAGSFTHLYPSDHRIKLEQGIVGWVARHGQLLLANDVRAELRYVNFFPDAIPTRSELAVPIRIGEQVAGVLDIQSNRINAFDENDVLVKQTLANQIAVAIQNASLYEAVRHELAERKEAEAALRASEERYRTLFENAVEGILVFVEGRVVLANLNSARMLGCANPQALVGLAASGMLEKDLGETIALYTRQGAREMLPASQCQARMRRQDGTKIDVVAVHVPIEYDGGPAVLMFVHDITEQLRTERRVAAIQHIGQSVASSLKADQIFERVVEGLKLILPFDRAYLSLLGDEVGFSAYDLETAATGTVVDMPPQHDLAGTPQSTLSIPLTMYGQLAGSLELACWEPERFTSRDQDVLDQLAPHISTALENARLFDQVRKARMELEALSRRLVVVQETERRSVARELHDEIGQTLTAVKISLQTIRRLPEITDSILAETISTVERSLQQVRSLSLDLRPSLLDDLGLVPAVRWYLNHQAQRTGLRVQLTADSIQARLLPELELACFRIVQEAMTNVMRHAQAQRVWVELQQQPAGAESGQAAVLSLTIRDDGMGFDVRTARERAAHGQSLGLLGMEERAHLIGGQIQIESGPAQGTRIHARFPLKYPVSQEG
jgi:PAS domain S-box-containing protein